MASAITHFVVGAALALPAMESRVLRGVLPRWAIPVTSGLLAVSPDLDTVAMQVFHIPHGSLFGHRGFFHSALFLALFAAALAAALALRAARHSRRSFGWLALLWAACAITHPLLDMLTDGGSGVMLLFPFSEARLFFPWRPIHVSPLGIVRFFSRAGYILSSEAPFDALAVAIGVAGWMARRK
jgi:inner membrane protein